VPEGWRFPSKSTTVSALWHLWWCGIPADRIDGLRFLKGFDMSVQVDEQYLSKARTLMEHLVDIVKEQRLLPVGVRNLWTTDHLTRDQVLQRAFLYMFTQIHPTRSLREFDDKRIGFESYLTCMYNLMSRKRLFTKR